MKKNEQLVIGQELSNEKMAKILGGEADFRFSMTVSLVSSTSIESTKSRKDSDSDSDSLQ